LEIAESQMSIEEFRGDDDEEDREEPREGVRGKVNPDGTIELEDKDQLTLEEIAALEAEAVEQVKGEGGPVIPENDDDLPF
jgi:hypothetical protein